MQCAAGSSTFIEKERKKNLQLEHLGVDESLSVSGSDPHLRLIRKILVWEMYGKILGWEMKLEKSYKSFFLENKTEKTFFH